MITARPGRDGHWDLDSRLQGLGFRKTEGRSGPFGVVLDVPLPLSKTCAVGGSSISTKQPMPRAATDGNTENGIGSIEATRRPESKIAFRFRFHYLGGEALWLQS